MTQLRFEPTFDARQELGPQALTALCPRPYPAKIYVEMTTRCNMRCRMCVKYAKGSDIPENDMSFEMFTRLSSSLAHADALIFSGIGEPLLNEDTPRCMALARELLPDQARMGLQTNGLLLDAERVRRLWDAGLDTVCVSVDLLSGAKAHGLHGGEHLPFIEKAFGRFRALGPKRARPTRLGVETVLLRDNFRMLPAIVRWAGEQGLDFLLASHMLPYDAAAADRSIANPNSAKAVALHREFRALAESEGLDLREYLKVMPKFPKTLTERRIAEIAEALRREAVEQGVWMNLHHVFAWQDSPVTEQLREVYEESAELAASYGLTLRLPPLFAPDERKCAFIEDQACFVDQEGNVSSCHFLWHRYTCYLEGVEKIVQPLFFGNIGEHSLEDVWRGRDYARFRAEAAEGRFPDCTNCGSQPCAEVTGHRGRFDHDCLGSTVPCGHCPWPSGMLACLD